jgi:hypothetical protein
VKNLLIVLTLVAAIGLVLAKRAQEKTRDNRIGANEHRHRNHRSMPRLVDLGAKMHSLQGDGSHSRRTKVTEYADNSKPSFIDVWENETAAEPYKINLIPTQIFFDAEGKEIWRHEGFLGKADILAKWKEFGVVN